MEHSVEKSEVMTGCIVLYYLTGVFVREYSFINCMVGRGHKSDSPNAAKYAAGGKLSREHNASRE